MVPGSLPNAVEGSGSTNAFMTIPGVESYPFQWANHYLREQYAGADEITDIVDLSVAWGSASFRPTLNWLPWMDFQARLRAWNVLNSAYPVYWATQGDGTNQVVYLYPAASQSLEMEWDVIALPSPLYSDNDFEILSDNFATAIKYGAAAMSLINSRPEQARVMFDNFLDTLGVGREASDFGKSESMYND
jgi:hypothetical protein